MKITSIQINNIRSFKSVPFTDLSKRINIFVGANNSGKSTILNCIFHIQRIVLGKLDITIGESEGKIDLLYEGSHAPWIQEDSLYNKFSFIIGPKGIQRHLAHTNMTHAKNLNNIPEQEPNNLIYPYLSKRKVASFSNAINENNANSVSGNFTYLYSKVDRLITPQFQPGNKQYLQACHEILGFEISSLARGDGKQAVYFVNNLEHIPLTAMGEGVVNILGLITDLCVAENRIFLIEEPENDIHPKALKSLLKLIIEKSSSNQFFVSTHSNIVMRYLGSVPESKVFNIKNNIRDTKKENLFLSTINEVSDNLDERRCVLEELGYEFNDFDLWKAWLFLEESSAEIIIRDYLIDWFIKPLQNKLRTFSACGSGNILPKFEDFNRLFIFMHLEPVYKNKVWIAMDGGLEESQILKKLKDIYLKNGWMESNFIQFKEHNFEKYYPIDFKPKVVKIEKITDKQTKREAKKQLLEEVKFWILNNETEAKTKFKESASEIIDFLKNLNKQIN